MKKSSEYFREHEAGMKVLASLAGQHPADSEEAIVLRRAGIAMTYIVMNCAEAFEKFEAEFDEKLSDEERDALCSRGTDS